MTRFQPRPRHASVILLVLCFLQGCAEKTDITISAGQENGKFYLISDQLKGLLERQEDSPVGKVTIKTGTGGSVGNIKKLSEKSDFALAGLISLLDYQSDQGVDYTPPRAVTPLLDYYMHLVVSPKIVTTCPAAESLETLVDCLSENDEKPRISIGKENSGTIVKAKGLLSQYKDFVYERVETSTPLAHLEGATREGEGKQKERVDIAFMSLVVPDPRIDKALKEGARLLDLKLQEDLAEDNVFARKELRTYIETEIPAFSYSSQKQIVSTVRDPVVLLVNESVDKTIVAGVLRTIYDQARYLRDIHPATDEIWQYFSESKRQLFRQVVDYHEGTDHFFERLKNELLIVSGPVNGMQYQRSKELQKILERYGVRSFVIPTRGTIANLIHLRDERPVLAMAQHDTAVASFLVDPISVYKEARPPADLDTLEKPEESDRWGVPKTEFKRIANLFPEVLLAIVDEAGPFSELCCSAQPQLEKKYRVSFGDAHSGTQVLSRALMSKLRLDDNKIEAHYLNAAQTRRLLQAGELDIGFVVSGTNSEMVNSLLSTPGVTTVGLEEQLVRSLAPGAALRDYSLSLTGKNNIDTIRTTAILLVNDHVESDVVRRIARAIHENRDQFVDPNIEPNRADLEMVSFASPIPFHPAAENYFRDVGLISGTEQNWVIALVPYVPVIGLLLTMIRPSLGRFGTIKFERAVASVDFEATDTVAQLRELQIRLKAAVGRRLIDVWHDRALPISTGGWRSIDALIEQRISTARNMLTNRLLQRVGDRDENTLAETEREILHLFQQGEIDMEQFDFLRRTMHHTLPDETDLASAKLSRQLVAKILASESTAVEST